MAGRPITVHTRKAERDRANQRRYYEKKRAAYFHTKPLAQVMRTWSTQ